MSDLESDLIERSQRSREFNLVLGSTIAVSLVFLFVSAVFGEAVMDLVVDEEGSSNPYRVPVWERSTLPYETEGDFGIALEVGPYEILATENEWNSTHHFVEYSLPISEGGAAPDDAVISLAVWRPNVPEGVKVPVIAEFGPYFQEASVETPSIEVPGTRPDDHRPDSPAWLCLRPSFSCRHGSLEPLHGPHGQRRATRQRRGSSLVW